MIIEKRGSALVIHIPALLHLELGCRHSCTVTTYNSNLESTEHCSICRRKIR